MSEAFFECWYAAVNHLDARVDGGIQAWLRCDPHPPFIEHLSFLLGNQLFFIRVEDVDGKVQGPGNQLAINYIAEKMNGHGCLLPMRKDWVKNTWMPDAPGWGLLSALTGDPVDPIALITDEQIVMTDWEIHDVAVRVVRDHLEQQGLRVISSGNKPDTNPAIWFVNRAGQPEWVVVRSSRYPAERPTRPDNWSYFVEGLGDLSDKGHFASVRVANAEQKFGEEPLPVWRAHQAFVDFDGLE